MSSTAPIFSMVMPHISTTFRTYTLGSVYNSAHLQENSQSTFRFSPLAGAIQINCINIHYFSILKIAIITNEVSIIPIQASQISFQVSNG